MRPAKERVKIVIGFVVSSGIISMILSIVIMIIALEHNPQGEFHSDGIIEWGHLLTLCGIWFIVAFLALFGLSVPIILLSFFIHPKRD